MKHVYFIRFCHILDSSCLGHNSKEFCVFRCLVFSAMCMPTWAVVHVACRCRLCLSVIGKGDSSLKDIHYLAISRMRMKTNATASWQYVVHDFHFAVVCKFGQERTITTFESVDLFSFDVSEINNHNISLLYIYGFMYFCLCVKLGMFLLHQRVNRAHYRCYCK